MWPLISLPANRPEVILPLIVAVVGAEDVVVPLKVPADVLPFFHFVDELPAKVPPEASFWHEAPVCLMVALMTPLPPVAAPGVQLVRLPWALMVTLCGTVVRPGVIVAEPAS